MASVNSWYQNQPGDTRTCIQSPLITFVQAPSVFDSVFIGLLSLHKPSLQFDIKSEDREPLRGFASTKFKLFPNFLQ